MIGLALVVGLLLATGGVWTNPILVGLLVGLPTSAYGFLAYRRAEEHDKAAATAATVAAGGNEIQRVIDGLKDIAANLHADNKEVRERATDLSLRLSECNAAYAELKRLTDSP